MSSCRKTSRLLVKDAHPNRDPSVWGKFVEYQGPNKVVVSKKPKPIVTEPGDAILKITTTTICGSDLHMYRGLVKGMEKGDILGHEFMGIIEDVGPDVKEFKRGDRVVASAVIACGQCFYCKNQWYSCCDATNPSDDMAKIYGHSISGIFGYSHLTGGFDGGQAEYARVPLADINLLKVPDSLPDEKVLFLSDIVCTGWHANELGEVSKGQTVAVWGCGPVGLMAQAWAKFRGARVIAIDNVPDRLEIAEKHLGSEVINFDEEDVLEAIWRLAPGGPDVGIEAAGFRYPKTFLHKLETKLGLAGDAMDILTEIGMAVRKCGNVSIVGDYFSCGNHFPIGAYMEKGLTMRGSQVFVQKYWKELLGYIENGQFDPTFVITHHMKLADAPEAYALFNNKEDNVLKVLLHVSEPTKKKTPHATDEGGRGKTRHQQA